MLSQQESNTLQRDLIQNFCEAEWLDKKTWALTWCTDGHAEQCRKLINLGLPTECINNFGIEIAMETKSQVATLIELSLLPLRWSTNMMRPSTTTLN